MNCIRAFVGAVLFAAITAGGAHGQTSAGDQPVPAPKVEKKSAAVRTLDAINIEGEIAVPQVLFITSREYRRYRDGLDLKFRMSILDVARSADLPTQLRFVMKTKEEEK